MQIGYEPAFLVVKIRMLGIVIGFLGILKSDDARSIREENFKKK